jgi:hypothetical protein
MEEVSKGMQVGNRYNERESNKWSRVEEWGKDQIEGKPAGELDRGQISGLADLQSRVLRCLAAVGKP